MQIFMQMLNHLQYVLYVFFLLNVLTHTHISIRIKTAAYVRFPESIYWIRRSEAKSNNFNERVAHVRSGYRIGRPNRVHEVGVIGTTEHTVTSCLKTRFIDFHIPMQGIALFPHQMQKTFLQHWMPARSA